MQRPTRSRNPRIFVGYYFTGNDPLSSNPVCLLDVLLKVSNSYTPQPLAANLDPSQFASLQQHPHCWQTNA